jgi:hypothetical protein
MVILIGSWAIAALPASARSASPTRRHFHGFDIRNSTLVAPGLGDPTPGFGLVAS